MASFAAWCARWGTIAFLMTVLVASLDEWHQTFLPSRTGTVRDVILDSSAAFVAQILIFMWMRWNARWPSETVVTLTG